MDSKDLKKPVSNEKEIKLTVPRNAVLDAAELRKTQLETDKLELELGELRKAIRRNDARPEEHHIYTFVSEVNHRSVEYAIQELAGWARQDPGCAITINLNSPGGSVIDGLAFFDYLKTLQRQKHDITIVTFGMAASMGGVLLQAGDTRIMTKNSWMLIHEVSSVEFGKLSEIEDQVKFIKRLQARCLDILASKANMTRTQIETKWKRKDWWLSAEEAKEHGFIDEIR